jgi:hypothetical protein
MANRAASRRSPAAEYAGVPEDDRAVTIEVPIEGDAVIRAAKETGQRALAVLKPCDKDWNAIEDAWLGLRRRGCLQPPLRDEHDEAYWRDWCNHHKVAIGAVTDASAPFRWRGRGRDDEVQILRGIRRRQEERVSRAPFDASRF